MVGEYRRGARLFTAPIAPPRAPAHTIRTPRERQRALARGGSFAWCTLLALRGTATIEDAAARALLATRAFVGGTDRTADFDSRSGTGEAFRLGARPASYLAASPLLSTLPGADSARVLDSLVRDDRRLLDALDAEQHDAPYAPTRVPRTMLRALV
ncbi:hypothetical protein AB1Y20_005684 [Prymnesium parvum]|uniref:Uncharacterized protein n=1 Tax=Prymnesium parvum TaxID=97485 RepID=A0AB34J763_PRYPA